MAALACTLQKGKQLPNVDVVILNNQGTREAVKLADFISKIGKDVLLNCVPGAFTKVCSESHLASYRDIRVKHAVVFISKDSSNVQQAWKEHEKAPNVIMISDAHLNFGVASGLVEPHATLGPTFRRAVIEVGADGTIKSVAFEKSNADCQATHAKNFATEKEEGKQNKSGS